MQKNYKWYVVGMLWFVCFLNYADRQAVFVLFPLLRVQLHLSTMQLGLLGSSFMWMYALFGPVAGWMGDRFSRRGLILGGLGFWLAITMATIVSRNYWQLAVLRGLSGIAEALYFPAAMSLISNYHGPETRSRAMSLHQSAVYGGTVGGGVVASMAGERFGWRSNFILLGAVGLLLFLMLLVFLKEPVRASTGPLEGGGEAGRVSIRRLLREILGAPLVLRLMVVFIGANFVAMIFMTWLPSFLFGKFHMGLSAAGVNATVYQQAASVLGVLSGGVLADRMARKSRSGRMRTQLIGLVMGVPFLLITGWAPSIPVLIGAMIGFGYCKGIYDSNTFAALHDVVPVELRASAVGITNSLGWLGGGLAPVAMAAASERFGMSICLSATSLVYALAAGVMLWNPRACSLAEAVSRRQASHAL